MTVGEWEIWWWRYERNVGGGRDGEVKSREGVGRKAKGDDDTSRGGGVVAEAIHSDLLIKH